MADESAETFEVEKVLKKRIVRGEVEYLLKWKGFGEEDLTWEAAKNVGCPELIEEFERQWEKKRYFYSKVNVTGGALILFALKCCN